MDYNTESVVTLGQVVTIIEKTKEDYTKAISEAVITATEEEVEEMLSTVFGG